MIPKSESKDIEYKRSAGAVETEDIVAFANSRVGGVIAVGVNEDRRKRSFDVTDIVGCDCRDSEKQKLLSKAQSCIPPITIDVAVRQHRTLSYFWVTIPSSPSKPHCTGKGTYTIRGDGRTHALDPLQLLEVFVTRESELFLNRFREATTRLEKKVHGLGEDLQRQFSEISGQVEWFQAHVEESLQGISGDAQDAQSFADEAFAAVGDLVEYTDEIRQRATSIEHDTSIMNEKLNALVGSLLKSPAALELISPDIRHLIGLMHLKYVATRKSPKTIKKEILATLAKDLDYIPRELLEQVFDQYSERRKARRSGPNKRLQPTRNPRRVPRG